MIAEVAAREVEKIDASAPRASSLLDEMKAVVKEVALEEVDQKNSNMLEQMLDGCGPIRRGSKMHEMIYGQGVLASSEFRRIQALPRRQLDMNRADEMTARWRNPKVCKGCTLCLSTVCSEDGTCVTRKEVKLLAIQAAMLADVVDANGALGPIAVGAGKTLLSLLIPGALASQSTVILVPPSVRRQLEEVDIPRYGNHFLFDTEKIHVVAYSELSSATKGDALDRYKPDLIVADEAHSLRNKQSARGKRFLRYLKENPSTRVVALSGTMTTRSVLDYQHLSEAALRKNSPLPSRWNELQDWASALDAKPLKPMKPGALMEFCAPGEDDHRAGFRRRLVETLGVVATSESSLGTSLILDALRPEAVVPPVIEEAIKKLKNTWAIGDEELEDAMRVVAVERQLAMGFYYVWDWPGGVPDREWLQARKDWHVVVRDILRYRSRKGLDSPLLVAAAASRGELRPEEQTAWDAWARVKDRPAPPTIPVWLDDFAMRRAAKIEEIGVIWTDHRAVEDWFRKHTSFPVYGAGDSRILDEKGDRTVVASIRAHGTGKNLQMWSYGLVMSPPANGQKLEQLLGRFHRPGQEADEVRYDFMLHTEAQRAAMLQAINDAEYVQETTGQKQKVLYSTRLFRI